MALLRRVRKTISNYSSNLRLLKFPCVFCLMCVSEGTMHRCLIERQFCLLCVRQNAQVLMCHGAYRATSKSTILGVGQSSWTLLEI